MLSRCGRRHLGSPPGRRCDEICKVKSVEPGGVAQEVGDASFGKPFYFGHVQLRDVVDERTVQPDQAVVDEAHHGSRRERLRAGSERKNGIRLQRGCWVSMTKHAKGFVHHDHTTPGHQHCYARSVTLLDPAADEFAQSPYPDGIHPDVLRYALSQLSAFHFLPPHSSRLAATRCDRKRLRIEL